MAELHNKTELKLAVNVQIAADKTMLTASITGNLDNIDFPAISQNPARTYGLWKTGCVEMFVSGEDGSYTEYNLGFCQNYEVLEFSGYRESRPRPEIVNPPKITAQIENGEFLLTAEFCEDIISNKLFSLTAVVKLNDGTFLHFANKHCGPKHDFHLERARELKLKTEQNCLTLNLSL